MTPRKQLICPETGVAHRWDRPGDGWAEGVRVCADCGFSQNRVRV